MDYLLSRVWVFTVWTYGISWSRYGVVRHSRRYIVFRGSFLYHVQTVSVAILHLSNERKELLLWVKALEVAV